MRRYGKRHTAVLICGATLSVAATVFAILDEFGGALAGISLLMGLGFVVTLDNRQRVRDQVRATEQARAGAITDARVANVTDRLAGLNRRVTDLIGRVEAGDTRLLSSIEAVRTDALDRHVDTIAHLDQPKDDRPAVAERSSNN